VKKKHLEAQKENVQGLLQIIAENPDLPIVPMVNSELVAEDYFAWWIGSWGRASIEEIYQDDERAYIRSRDEEMLIDDALYWLEDKAATEEEAYELAKKEVEGYDWKKVIAVRIELPVI